ncbi:Sphingosine kinase 1 [Heracleum sosnowskyi]|uniref:sphingosine kinase n=1 Tax=Heracleum sosnowskyi TaxID=360622 RepID=A0AAD8MMP3_9APIA|nr:Sphingosine kinase 1 [Heracleum sosnowskyi]
MDQHRQTISDLVKIDGITTTLTLTYAGKLSWNDGGDHRSLTIEKEVLGFSILGSKIFVKTIIDKSDAYCCTGDKTAPLRKSFVFEPLSEASLQLWSNMIQENLDSLAGRPKKLLILVNPFGGRKSALKIFAADVKPLLEDANILYTMKETRHQLHAKEIASEIDLSMYDGIVCVSGDGVLVEVVNGLMEREDWESAMKMPLGVVPAGTGNGMAKSLLDTVGQPCTALYAVLAIIRGHKRSLDVATILQGETRFYSVLMLAWGLVADIDIESERFRWLGNARMDFYALLRIFHLRTYNGHIYFVPAPGYEKLGDKLRQQSVECSGDSCAFRPNQELPIKIQQHGYRQSNVDLQKLNWKKIDGPFVSVWLHNVPWGSEVTMAAPDAKFADGYLDLIVMRTCSKLSLLALMIELNNGNHVKSPDVLYLKVKAFILEPGSQTADPSKEGIIDSDGEVLARGNGTYKCKQKSMMTYDKLQITVEQGLATLFSPI